jgi:hypothetical protein
MKRRCLCHQLNDTTGLLDLLLRQLAHPPRAHDERDLGKAALAEDLGVAEGEEVEDGDGVLLGAGNVGLAGLGGDESPELLKHALLANLIFCQMVAGTPASFSTC